MLTKKKQVTEDINRLQRYTTTSIVLAYMYTMHMHRFKGISKIRVFKDKDRDDI